MFIKVTNVSKIFHFSTMDQIKNLGMILLGKNPAVPFRDRSIVAVDNVSFKIDDGDCVGIIGRNGAGKTTLLQMITGFADPTSGTIGVEGHISCIMTLGVGLREDQSGRENIYVDGEIQGKSRSEIDKIISDIITFADIGEFIDYPVRTYSSGMKSRLAFSMIAFIKPEILIIDEVLSAGDARFSRKAFAKMKEICEKGKIVIIVSHSLGYVVDMCNRCLWIDSGRIVMDDTPKFVTEAYREYLRRFDEIEIQEKFKKRISTKSCTPGFELVNVEFLDDRYQPRLVFDVGEELTIRLTIRTAARLERPDLKISFERIDGILLMENLASEDGFECEPIEGESVFEISMGPIFFGKNTYQVHVELLDRDSIENPLLAALDKIFKIENPYYPYENPSIFSPAKWSIESIMSDEVS